MSPIETDVATVAAQKLAEIKTEITDLVQRREQLLVSALAELTAHGIEARAVDNARWQDLLPAPKAGDRVHVIETYGGYTGYHRSIWREGRLDERVADLWGPRVGIAYEDRTSVIIHRGLHEILLVDDSDALLVRIGPESEEQHRRAVARLRTQARHDGIRVHVRDREVTLDDGMGNTLHTGDAESAFFWLFNIDPTQR